MYNVVFEYKKEAGAYAGVRTWTSYQSKEEFKRLAPPENLDTRERILAEDVTESEAILLTSQTPEICRLLVAVEEMCYHPNGTVDLNLAPYQITKALMAIEEDRSHRDMNNLPANKNIPEFEIGKEDTEKNRFLRYILETFIPRPDGTIGFLFLAENSLKWYIIKVKLDRLVNK